MKTARYSPFLMLLAASCITPYTPNISYPQTGYLVVEGNLNGGQSTTITLSRTSPISDTDNQVFENGASVVVEGSDGSSVPLAQSGPGQYSVADLPLDTNKEYRLFIQTKDGDEFLSEYVKVVPTPPIDSVNWAWLPDGVHIYVSTHNPLNNTRNYQWTWTETWEYHSAEESFFYWDVPSQQVLPRDSAQQIFTCWRGGNSPNLLLYSTAKLSEDKVNQYQIDLIPNDDQRLSVLYSILVSEVGLSDSAYAYLQVMLANTENLGSLFDPLPTQLYGNIHSTKNPSEQVIGYVNASAVSQARYFINEPAGWGYSFSCPMPDTIPPPVWYPWFFQGVTPSPYPVGVVAPCCLYIPVAQAAPPATTGFDANVDFCIDCTLMGGTTVKPSFWP